jgi:hypothetical protein
MRMEVIILAVASIGAHFNGYDFATLHFYISLAFALYKAFSHFTNDKTALQESTKDNQV